MLELSAGASGDSNDELLAFAPDDPDAHWQKQEPERRLARMRGNA